MKESSRIILNTLATYTRSVFAIVVSLFSARWVLEALGQTDFGLYGVVGSIILLITALTGGLRTGAARFYAYAIGQGHHLSEKEAIDDLQYWFNISLSIHLILPFILVLVSYPIGTYAIENWLTIPADRISACHLVFRISLLTAFANIISVPFVAMYQAKQLIAELAIFDIFRSIGIFVGAYFLLRVNADRLIVYALYMTALNVGIPALQIFRAFLKFKACRPRFSYMYDRTGFRELFSYVGWKTFGLGCVAVRTQGSPIMINLFFGPQVNAAYSIANRVSIQATMLSTAMMGAFQPAITSMEGRGDREKMLKTSLQVCKYGALLVLLFVIPLVLEMENVLTLWLRTPPQYAGPLCQWMLVMLAIDRITSGHMLAVNARGKIALYELVQGPLLLSALPMAWLLFKGGFGPVAMGWSLAASMVLYCSGRLIFCKKLLGLPIFNWVKQVALPVAGLTACSAVIGLGIIQNMDAGFYRLCFVTATTGLCSLALGWVWLLNKTERMFVLNTIKRAASRLLLR